MNITTILKPLISQITPSLIMKLTIVLATLLAAALAAPSPIPNSVAACPCEPVFCPLEIIAVHYNSEVSIDEKAHANVCAGMQV